MEKNIQERKLNDCTQSSSSGPSHVSRIAIVKKLCAAMTASAVVWLVYVDNCHMPKPFAYGTMALVILSFMSGLFVSVERKKTRDVVIGLLWALLWFPWLCYELLSRPDVSVQSFAYTSALVVTATVVAMVIWFMAKELRHVLSKSERSKPVLILCLLAGVSSNVIASAPIRIEPTDWYVGLKNPTLQLMLYGKDVGDATVRTDYPGVRVDSIVRLDSPNYLLVYLNIADAQAGEMMLRVNGKRIRYQLKQREKRGEERIGFTCSDVLYQLVPDRFASGTVENDQLITMNRYQCDRSNPNLRHGGNLEGIRQHLDYFNELGVTALWFTPVLENNSPDRDGYSTYHGYAPTNYYQIDPRFGSNDDYRRLCDEAHEHGLKMVMDMIFNHCGFEHPWVADIPSRDWFNCPEWLEDAKGEPTPNAKYQQTSYQLTPVRDLYASEIDLHETTKSWFVPTMPDLNQHNPHVLRYLIQNSIWWIETIGIDGIRMDTYPYAFEDAMSRWMQAINEEYPNYNVVGETWVTEPAYTASWQKDNRLTKVNPHLPTVMDFAFYDRMVQAAGEDTNDYGRGLNRIYNSLVYDYLYPNPRSVMAFIENHDTDRFLADGCDTLALRQALALLLTIPRIPQLYYGVEILLNGTKEKSDGNVRQDFPGGFWDDSRNAFTTEGRTAAENSMFRWLSRLLHWRQGNEVIAKGRMTQFIPHRGIYVIARQYKGKTVLTILNGTNHVTTMPISRYREVIGQHRQATNIVCGCNVDISKDIQLQPRETLILEL